MHDALVVQCLDGAGESFEEAGGGLGRLRAAPEVAVQAATTDVLHGHERPWRTARGRVQPGFVDLDDVGMADLHGGPRLGLEALGDAGIVQGGGMEHLDRDGAAEVGIPSQVDDAVAALPKAAPHLVLADPPRQFLGGRGGPSEGTEVVGGRVQGTRPRDAPQLTEQVDNAEGLVDPAAEKGVGRIGGSGAVAAQPDLVGSKGVEVDGLVRSAQSVQPLAFYVTYPRW